MLGANKKTSLLSCFLGEMVRHFGAGLVGIFVVPRAVGARPGVGAGISVCRAAQIQVTQVLASN